MNVDGKSCGRLWIYTDITARKEAEAVLARSHRGPCRAPRRRAHRQTPRNGRRARTFSSPSPTTCAPHSALCRALPSCSPKPAPAAKPRTRSVSCRRISTSASRMDSLIVDALNYNRTVRRGASFGARGPGRPVAGYARLLPRTPALQGQYRGCASNPPRDGKRSRIDPVLLQPPGQRHQVRKARPNTPIRIWAETQPSSPPQNPPPSAPPSRPSTVNDKPLTAPVVRVWVEDNGIGIPQSMLPRVFDIVLPRPQHLRRHRHRPRPGAKGHGPHGRQGRRRIRRRQRQPLLARFQAGQITPSSSSSPGRAADIFILYIRPGRRHSCRG